VGIQDPESEAHAGIPVDRQHANLFVAGSTGDDSITVDYQSATKVVFTIKGGAEVASNICTKGVTGGTYTVTCNLEERKLGSVVILGGDGNDDITDGDLDRTLPGSVVMLGGSGSDILNGSSTDELLLDGSDQASKREELLAGGGDDVVIQGDGSDRAMGGNGNDLLMSSEICQNDTLIGDDGKGNTYSDNAQFHAVQKMGVYANLIEDKLGQSGQPEHKCADGTRDDLKEFDDLEGSPQADIFEGDNHENLLLGRGNPDVLRGKGGRDTLNARDEAHDNVIDCGSDPGDHAHIDEGKDNVQSAKAHCEKVDERGTAYISSEELLEAALSVTDEDSPPATAAAASVTLPPVQSSAYPLDEESGVVADNVIEGMEDGTYENASVGSGNEQGPVLGVAGAELGEDEGSAVALDGVNDYIELGEEPEPEPEAEEESPEGFSIELWAKFDQAPTEKEYLYSGMDEGEGPFLYRAADGNVVFGTHTEAGTPEVSTAEPIDDGAWHQVVGTLEGEEIRLYVDGFPHRMDYGQPVIDEQSEPEEEVVGTSGSTTHFLDGTVDDVIVYETAVPEDAIALQLASSKAEEPETMLAPVPDSSDLDGDSVGDSEDNCVNVPNSGQEDADLDGTGDACVPPDSDGDGLADSADDCPEAYNPSQVDRDGDGVGAECDANELEMETGAATSVAATLATLAGTIDPEGTETSYLFEYGTTTSYGSKAPLTAKPIGAGIEEVAVSETLSGLQPGTTYHYRVVASGEAGTTYGEDRSFETQALTDTEARLAAMALSEPFDGSSASLSSFGSSWSALGWAGGNVPKGQDTASGWGPSDGYSTVNGTSYNPTLSDTGWGTAAAVRMGTNPANASRYFSIWLDMPNPSSATRAGYELRFTDVATNSYNVTLTKWVSGVATQLASKTSYAFVNGSSLALVDQGGNVSAWTNTGSGYAQLLSAADGTYDGGKAGVEGSGNITRLNQFRAGALNYPGVLSGTASEVRSASATLNGSVDPEGLATTYQFEYGPTAAYGSKAPSSSASAGSGTTSIAISQAISSLTPGTTYHYRLVATSEAGTSYGEDKSLTTPTIALPTYRSAFGTSGAGAGQFSHPAGIAVDPKGFLWAVDQNNNRVEKFGLGGEYLGSFGTSGTGTGQFGRPTDVAIGANGTLFVADAGNNRIEKFNEKGEFLTKFGSYGSGNGQLSSAETLATDGKGALWVGDTYNARLQKFTEAGEFVKVVGSRGSGPGQMIEPTGIDVGPNGKIWVADWGNNRISVFTEAGEFVRQFGSEGSSNGQFLRPDVVEVDNGGRVWVGDQNNGRVQQFTEAGEYVNQFGSKGTGTGQFTFGWPMGIASNDEGVIWVADTGNNRVQRWSYGP
jgi:sugar lactone lactonase YvrE